MIHLVFGDKRVLVDYEESRPIHEAQALPVEAQRSTMSGEIVTTLARDGDTLWVFDDWATCKVAHRAYYATLIGTSEGGIEYLAGADRGLYATYDGITVPATFSQICRATLVCEQMIEMFGRHAVELQKGVSA